MKEVLDRPSGVDRSDTPEEHQLDSVEHDIAERIRQKEMANVSALSEILASGTAEDQDVIDKLWKTTNWQDFLIKHGILEICAKHGNTAFLNKVLRRLEARITDNDQIRQVLKQVSFKDTHTTLGWAISRGHIRCITALAEFSRKNLQPHLFEDEDACGPAQKTLRPTLHFALQYASIWTQRWASDHEAHLEELATARDTVIAVIECYPPTLCQYDAFGKSPYQFAKELNRLYGYSAIENSVKSAIFEKLQSATLVRKALYGTDSKNIT